MDKEPTLLHQDTYISQLKGQIRLKDMQIAELKKQIQAEKDYWNKMNPASGGCVNE